MMAMLQERWRHLAARERMIVAIGTAVVVASLLFLIVIDPLITRIDKVDRQTARKSKERVELSVMATEYAAKQARLAKLEQRLPAGDGQFSLLAFMEEAAASVQIRDRIVGMQPQQATVQHGYQEMAVDLRLDGVQLPQLLALLVALVLVIAILGRDVLLPFVFAGLIFSQSLFTPLVWPALAAFAIFCALSGAVYLFNDLADMEKDRLHPTKRRRPIASGALSVPAAVALGVLTLVGSLVAAYALSARFGVVATVYAALLTAYSVWLKHVVILDVLTVAIGFVLRAVAGAAAIGVDISGWLVICTILVALFLALGKRRHEYLTLHGDAAAHRPILAEYSESFLDQMVAVVTASTVTAYALYTMSPDTVAKFHTRWLPLTLPFVLYGVFRYLYLLYRRELGGNPSDLLLSDRALLINTVLWMVALLLIIYGPVWGPVWLTRWLD